MDPKVVKMVNEAVPRAPSIGQLYKHYKGDTYLILEIAQCTETGGLRIIYKKASRPNPNLQISEGPVYDRPILSWIMPLTDGSPRFVLVEESDGRRIS